MILRWSASKINDANYCRRKYCLKHVLRDHEIIFSGFRRGKLVHSLIENFWNKLGERDEIRRNKNGRVTSKKKYSNSDEFVDYAKGQWIYMMKQDEASEREIEWRFDNEMGIIRNDYFPKVCGPLFKALVKEGPPIKSELRFDFMLDGRRFAGYIDEVRLDKEEVIIRDYKTESPWLRQQKIEGNPQMTLYCVGLCALCYGDEEFARKLGLDDEREKFMGNPIYISSRVKPEFFMIDTLTRNQDEVKTMPSLTYRTQRRDRDFHELLLNIEDVEGQISVFLSRGEKRIPPTERGKKCDYCEMKRACKKRLEEELNDIENEQKPIQDKSGQTYFTYVPPYFRKPKKRRKSQGQGRIRWGSKKK